MLFKKIPLYNIELKEITELNRTVFLKEKFYIELSSEIFSELNEKVIVSFPGALEIRIIKRSYTDVSEDIISLKREGCFYFNENNEYILEAECIMETSDKKTKDKFFVRLPMSAPFTKNTDIGFYFDGVWLRFMKDGEVLNENSGYDRFCDVNGEAYAEPGIKISAAKDVSVDYREEKSDMSAEFYFPHGWNTNVGDVMAFSHNGICHLMYLHDRRHHGSRNGQGAHYICHLTTENLKDWYEHEPIAEIDTSWQTYGTGTMVYHNGKYYMFYGFHTERYPGGQAKIELIAENCEFRQITFEEVSGKGGLPAGASYSVSDDGIHFKPSGKLIHASRNPSAYVNQKNEIVLYCGYGGDGVWKSESIDKPFRKDANNFTYYGEDVFMKNSSECPAFVNWNGYKYLIIGFTGYYRTFEKNSDNFSDATILGENIYDGLSVPMVYEFGDNRRIIAGWVKSPLGWGGVLMQRELIQEQDGKLGMKWVPELIPEKLGENIFDESGMLPSSHDYILEMTVKNEKSGKFGLVFSNSEATCVFQLDFEKGRAQFSDTQPGRFAEEIPTAYEQMKCAGNPEKLVDIPQNSKNYSIPDVDVKNDEFSLRVISRYSNRLKATVIDVEIAEKRTMISVRDNFIPDKVSVISDGKILLNNKKLHIIGVVKNEA